jgi:DNA invertase Pin-like site-specific DNA recombinase
MCLSRSFRVGKRLIVRRGCSTRKIGRLFSEGFAPRAADARRLVRNDIRLPKLPLIDFLPNLAAPAAKSPLGKITGEIRTSFVINRRKGSRVMMEQMKNPRRAVLYLRVSTTRQAEQDVSIPDQRRQGEAYCLARQYELVDSFVEMGASALNDRRPAFRRMIEAATGRPPPFDIIVVHSFSRFFRDHFELEFYIRKLRRSGVALVSITQEMGDDPVHAMMRQVMALFDEYQSKETAKHVIRALKENARQGFWNGALPPLGYRVVAAERRGFKIKKKLEIDVLHAETIKLIYRLALRGDRDSGPMGIKRIASYLNDRNLVSRNGGRWGVGQVHRILTRRTYIGEHAFNQRSKSGKRKPASEIIMVPVPPIIDRDVFDTVQALLKRRRLDNKNPSAPAQVAVLLGLVRCANCDGALTIRTGKSGRYRYYACSIRARQGVKRRSNGTPDRRRRRTPLRI